MPRASCTRRREPRVDERARQARVLVERVVDVQKIVAPVLVEAASHGRVRELAVPPPGLRVD